MRLVPILAVCATVALGASTTFAAPVAEDSDVLSQSLTRRDGCSGGVHVCCASTSVGCSNGVCKACCGNQCGCFYERGGTCSSNPNVSPCVDVSKPDFNTTNGQCTKPSSSRSGLFGNGGGLFGFHL